MKKLLIVVDYQNDFVSGSLGFDGGKAIEPNIVKKICAYRAAGNDILFTMDTHGADYRSTEEGRHLPVDHCIKGSTGWELTDTIATLRQPEDACFEKPTFPSLKLGEYLSGKDYDTVELVGLVSNICVLSNAVIAKAALPNAHIIVDASCTAGADQELHQKALDVMDGLHIEVTHRPA
ncbi:MAG: cysteine hydrolase family protein [Oscillospiraceae bacterium]|jgi:nicotinamidase/pyrazinamidase